MVKKYNIYKKLNEIESELNDSRFLRSHQSYLVNMDYIIEAGNQFQLSTGDVVLIRQRHVKEIRNQYLKYNENIILIWLQFLIDKLNYLKIIL